MAPSLDFSLIGDCAIGALLGPADGGSAVRLSAVWDTLI